MTLLIGVALAALFLWLPSPDASDTRLASQSVVQTTVKFSAAEEAMIKRRATARVQRLIRLAQKSKNSKKQTTDNGKAAAKAKANAAAKAKAKTPAEQYAPGGFCFPVRAEGRASRTPEDNPGGRAGV
jgi:hypothetical protein